MAEEVEIIVKQLDQCRGEINDILLEVRLANQSNFTCSNSADSKGKLIERLELSMKDIKDGVREPTADLTIQLKNLELETNDSELKKEWRKNIKDLRSQIDFVNTQYLGEDADDEGMFDNDADAVVRKQNDKLSASLKNMKQAEQYGIQTKEEQFRMNQKLKGAKVKVKL